MCTVMGREVLRFCSFSTSKRWRACQDTGSQPCGYMTRNAAEALRDGTCAVSAGWCIDKQEDDLASGDH